MRAPIDASTILSLTQQIGDYENKGKFCISYNGEQELYQGIEEYEQTRIALTQSYIKDFEEDLDPYDSSDPQFFRKKFLEYIQKHNFPEYKGNIEQRNTQPEQATTEMEQFFW
ncbi:hypothetical protein [Legionella sp. WA2022007384]